jgi:parallel beta-helix repeat protein
MLTLAFNVHQIKTEATMPDEDYGLHTYVKEATQGTFPFESIFKQDLLDIANSVPEIEEIYIKNYLDMRPIALWAFIRITYIDGLSDYEKIDLQYYVESELISKWYIDFVEPNYYAGIPEDPPPPWPGFVIGDLNVRFIDELLVHNMNTGLSYQTIQEAITNANEGDTIFVSSGIYYERLVVNKAVSLVGENEQNTIIDGNYSGTVVNITKTNDVSLTGFTIRNAGYWPEPSDPHSAVLVQNSTGTILSHNIIDNSSYGIRVYYSDNSTFTDNTVIGHNWADFGIYIHRSNSCIISGNNVSGGWAITIKGSYNSKVTDNVVFAKGKYGIRLGWSHNNLIAYNTILNATAGPPNAPSWGLWLSYYSTNNMIHHNNFLNNSNQAYSYNLTNFWDNGCEGNYWSNYNGTDLDGDGIGDTPYIIDENNTDNYPLMNPYWNLADIDHDLNVDIYDVVLCASAYGSTPSDPNWDPHCDIAEPYGIIDIYDIVMIAGSYGKEYS